MSYAFVVSNPNTDVTAQNLLYQMAAYNEQGVVLTTDSGTIASVGPGQQLGVANEVLLSPQLVVSRIDLVLRQGTFLEGASSPQLPVDQPAFVPGQPPSLTGIVKNPGNQDLADITVVGIAYQDGAIVGGGTTKVTFVPAQGQAAFSMPVATSGEPDRVEFFTTVGGP